MPYNQQHKLNFLKTKSTAVLPILAYIPNSEVRTTAFDNPIPLAKMVSPIFYMPVRPTYEVSFHRWFHHHSTLYDPQTRIDNQFGGI